jgi:aldose 1-epimerase
MNQTIELNCDNLRCQVEPALGGCITGLWLGGVPVLRSGPAGSLTTARQSGCYPLVPFSNRIAHATLKWQGTLHPLIQNNASEPHAIHGVGWQAAWTVLESDAQFAMLSFEHRKDSAWPFAFDASQTFRLRPGVLELTLGITNQSGVPAPVGLGWHPFFVKRAKSHIAFEASGRWEMGDDKLPTHRSASHGIDADCALLDVDHCFDGWNHVVQLRDEALHSRITSNLNHLVVFTNGTRDMVAIEPVSHVNNALNLMDSTGARAEELGVRVLQPGESMTAQMSIHIDAVR